VRELRNVLQKAAALTGNGIIHAKHIQFEGASDGKPKKLPPAETPVAVPIAADTHGLSIEELEIRHIRELLEQHTGHRRRVADILGISERTLYRKLNRYGLHGAK
jgi:DNA-binding NtrC family response regulator